MVKKECYKDKNGYWRITCENFLLHRLIAEELVVNRDLDVDEIVHHINEDKEDNRPENLQAMTWEEHNKLHLDEVEKEGQKCIECGVLIQPNPNKLLCYACWIKEKYIKNRCE